MENLLNLIKNLHIVHVDNTHNTYNIVLNSDLKTITPKDDVELRRISPYHKLKLKKRS